MAASEDFVRAWIDSIAAQHPGDRYVLECEKRYQRSLGDSRLQYLQELWVKGSQQGDGYSRMTLGELFEWDIYDYCVYHGYTLHSDQPLVPTIESSPSTALNALSLATPQGEVDDLASAPQQKSRLLSLPPELRNTIYSYAVFEPLGVKADKSTLAQAMTPLWVCRQMRVEAGGIFFGDNTFNLTLTFNPKTWGTFVNWLKAIGPQASKVKSLVINYQLEPFENETLVAWSENLRHMAKPTMTTPYVKKVSKLCAERTGDAYIKSEKTLELFFPLLRQTALPLASISTPAHQTIDPPTWDTEYQLSLFSNFFTRNVARHVRDSRPRSVESLRYGSPTEEEVRTEIPEDGILFTTLVSSFVGRGKGYDLLTLIRRVGIEDEYGIVRRRGD